MTLVPRPAFSGGSGLEVSAAKIHDTGGEAQEAAVSVGPAHPGSRGGQAVLLVSASQQVERPVLQVCRLLDQLGVQHKVRSGCRGHNSVILLPLHKFTVALTVLNVLDLHSTQVTPAALPSPPLGQYTFVFLRHCWMDISVPTQ